MHCPNVPLQDSLRLLPPGLSQTPHVLTCLPSPVSSVFSSQLLPPPDPSALPSTPLLFPKHSAAPSPPHLLTPPTSPGLFSPPSKQPPPQTRTALSLPPTLSPPPQLLPQFCALHPSPQARRPHLQRTWRGRGGAFSPGGHRAAGQRLLAAGEGSAAQMGPASQLVPNWERTTIPACLILRFFPWPFPGLSLSSTPPLFPEHLLCARSGSRCWAYAMNKKQKSLVWRS